MTISTISSGSSTRLLRTAVLLTGDRAAAEDLVQETYERVYVRWRRIHSAPEAYARKTLANLAANRWRSRGPTSPTWRPGR
ncbi:sigma factor [Kribbella sp. NPDC002412]